MEKKINVGMQTLAIVCIILLVVSVGLFFMRQAEIEKRIGLEKRLEELTKEKTRLSKELEEIAVIKKDLETELQGVQEKIKFTESQLQEEKRAKDSAFAQLESEKRESKRLVDELMRIKDEKEKVSLALARTENERGTLMAQLSSIQQAKEIVENRLKEALAKKEVELQKIVVKPEGTPTNTNPASAAPAPPQEAVIEATAPDIKGEVLVVNKKFDFVVVNLGEANGLAVGMNLGVYRDKKMLATLQVEKVHANMAAAKIPPEWKNADIKEGDAVAVVK